MTNLRGDLEETKELFIRLEHYDDIFSDFDMRPYSRRALSVDFLDEIKRATTESGEEIELELHVPAAARNEHQEATIKDRLAAHFERHFRLKLKERGRVLRLGIIMVVLGIISMIGATFVAAEETTNDILFSFLLIFLEPAAWFLLWEGMDQVIFNSKSIKPELDFYKKMASKARIHFKGY